jgi:hypothetical protein
MPQGLIAVCLKASYSHTQRAAHAPAQYTPQQQPQYATQHATQQHAPQAQFAPPPAYMQVCLKASYQSMPEGLIPEYA